MFDNETMMIVRRLQEARLSLMKSQPFYAVLLLHMQFSLDPMCETAYTDGERIAFGPDFINDLSDSELEFVLMHEVLHAALNHCGRTCRDYDFDDFNTACDIVVNSNILSSCNMDPNAITLKKYGESMHVAPDGTEGYKYSAEDVYQLIKAGKGEAPDNPDQKGNGTIKNPHGNSDNKDSETEPDRNKNEENRELTGNASRNDGGFDDHTYWDNSENEEKKQDGADNTDDSASSAGKQSQDEAHKGNGQPENSNASGEGQGDDDTGVSSFGSDNEMKQVWLQRMVEATQISQQISKRRGSKSCGNVPLGIERLIREYTEPQTDWRTVLDSFIQEEITDYSFNPPDRRFQDSIFLLPDYNEKDDSLENILFMIDTSGSMSDDMITQAYSEIKGAIDQFDGRLKGWLGFFDASVIEPKPFEDEDELRIIRPQGGGGTNFHSIFRYVEDHLKEGFEPVSIVILTDGYAEFPDEKEAMDIPVLWLINNEVVTPPWGKVTRIKIDNE